MSQERVAPILPARDLEETRAFYEAYGFMRYGDVHDGYLMVIRGAWELHFFAYPELDVKTNYCGAYLRCSDVSALDADWRDVPVKTPSRASYGPSEDKHWGMREITLIDLNGNLLRIGQELP